MANRIILTSRNQKVVTITYSHCYYFYSVLSLVSAIDLQINCIFNVLFMSNCQNRISKILVVFYVIYFDSFDVT